MLPRHRSLPGTPLPTRAELRHASGFDIRFQPDTLHQDHDDRQVVPTSLLPEGTVYWRVRSNAATGPSAWATTEIKVAATQAPTPLGLRTTAPYRATFEPAVALLGRGSGATSY